MKKLCGIVFLFVAGLSGNVYGDEGGVHMFIGLR